MGITFQTFATTMHKSFNTLVGIPDYLDPDANGDGIPDCNRNDSVKYHIVRSFGGSIKKVIKVRQLTQEEDALTRLKDAVDHRLHRIRALMDPVEVDSPAKTASLIKIRAPIPDMRTSPHASPSKTSKSSVNAKKATIAKKAPVKKSKHSNKKTGPVKLTKNAVKTGGSLGTRRLQGLLQTADEFEDVFQEEQNQVII